MKGEDRRQERQEIISYIKETSLSSGRRERLGDVFCFGSLWFAVSVFKAMTKGGTEAVSRDCLSVECMLRDHQLADQRDGLTD